MSKRRKWKCIYVLLGPNRSAYIGQTSDPINRKSRYKTLTCKNQRLVYESLLAFGFDKHQFKILIELSEDATRDQMDFYEIFYHSIYQELGYRMMNLKSPGWNGVSPVESIKIGADKRKGIKPWNTGTKGVVKAWNKGLHIPIKKYFVKKNGVNIVIDDLQTYCAENYLSYTTMLTFLKGKRGYLKLSRYKEYERV